MTATGMKDIRNLGFRTNRDTGPRRGYPEDVVGVLIGTSKKLHADRSRGRGLGAAYDRDAVKLTH